VFPQRQIDEIDKQEHRVLKRFDVDFDLPFTLPMIKDSPPYLHDGRLLTLDDTVEFFNLVPQLKLNAEEMQALVAYMRAL
jgi:cytochrome c peroxidase